jgi:hypothetical protein
MKSILLLCCIALGLVPALAQRSTLTGLVTDSLSQPIAGASVVLLAEKDSVIVAFGTAGKDGAFSIKRVEKGRYLLQVSSSGFTPLYMPLLAGSEPVTDLGPIRLLPEPLALTGVDIVAERMPMSMSNDTINYYSAAFKTQPGAVVEDLLKKLPGIEVQPDGTIKAQGEVVRNVMVDGKPFFGDDPKVATKNLPADAVGKVQVFDKKSERAEFTGVDDGESEKSINLALKPDAKRGFFGTAMAGYGTKNRFDSKLNGYKFSGKTQISAIGNLNNINRETFSLEDYINFMGGLSNMMQGGSMRLTLDDSNAPSMGNPTGNGFSTAGAGGLQAHHQFNKHSYLNANYMYTDFVHELEETTERQNWIGDAFFNTNAQDFQKSSTRNHKVNLGFRSKLDSAQKITANAKINLNTSAFNSQLTGSSLRENTILQNDNTRDYQSDGNRWSAAASATYNRRLNRRGRVFSADAGFQQNSNTSGALLDALNRYYQAADTLRTPIRQRQAYEDLGDNWNIGLAYTEPIGRGQFLETRISHRQYNNNTEKSFFDRPTGEDIFNPLLSSLFKRGYRYERASLSWRLVRSKYRLQAGGALQQSALSGKQLAPELAPVNRNFTRFLPHIRFNHERKTGRNFSLDYSTRLREPALEELQPVVDNSNPLEVYQGNPGLQPEYIHQTRLQYMLFDAFSGTSLFTGADIQYTQDKIANSINIDALLQRSTRPVNTDYHWQYNQYAQFSRPIRPLKIKLNLSADIGVEQGLLVQNGGTTRYNRWNNAGEISVENKRKGKFDVRIGANISLNNTTYAGFDTDAQAFVNQRYFGDIDWYPNDHWAVNTRLDYNYYSNEAFGQAQQIPIWKASVTRYVLKNRKGQLKLSAFDLLNRNAGVTRNNTFNYVEEKRTRNLSRYFLLSFAYAMSGFKSEKDKMIRIN